MTAAIFIVRGLLVSALEGLGLTALEHRNASDALQLEEMDAVLVTEGETGIDEIEGRAGGTVIHRTRFFLEFAARATPTATAREMAFEQFTTGIGGLMADFTLGGNVMELIPVSYGGEEDDGKDYAVVSLDLDVTYCTSTTDWGTLLT